MSKDIGIITHLYKSTNYGGVLQAYALCKYINEQGYSAEQIQYEKIESNAFRKKLGKIYRSAKRVLKRIKYKDVYTKIDNRKLKFEDFKKNHIAQSNQIYNFSNWNTVIDEYNMFITGSDQVWHPNAVCDAYLLSFETSGIKKMSYAASVAKDTLSDNQKNMFHSALKDYQAISVREKSTVSLIQEVSPVEVNWVLDPVFLLEREEWIKFSGDPIQKEKYIFCYFLGDSASQKKIVNEYAKKKSLKIISIAYLSNEYNINDNEYLGEKIIDADPRDFVRLIRDAEIIFTDSFHAMAFSLIFRKEFFVFERNSKSTMSSRIISLLEMYGLCNRFIDNELINIEKYINYPLINYENSEDKMRKMRMKSILFLTQNIANCLGES